MKHIVFAGLLCAAISPVFAASSNEPPRIAAARAAMHSNSLNPVPRNELYAMLAAGITLLAYAVRNKAARAPIKK